VPPLPLPPEALMRRVGWDVHSRRPGDVYEERGREQWRLIRSLLPEDWSFEGKRVLDFGCGAGRIVRHALSEDPAGEYWGCDIDARSIEWLRANLSPPLHPFLTDEWPPTPEPDGQFQLIYAFSVFTHLLDNWSAWLVELHRLLGPDGLAVITVFGPGISSHADVPIEEDAIGMNVLSPGTEWDAGGPLIVHSEWWLHAHWGRAFEIVELRPGVPGGPPPLFGQSILVMRRRPGSFTTAELERFEPDEPRELAAVLANLASLRREVENQAEAIRIFQTSKSWRLTAPLRAIAAFARKHR
jgi:SAM-dependent methyltransferase